MRVNKSDFTHKGLMYGFVPIYINMDEDAPLIGGRNFLCDILFDVSNVFFGFCAWTMSLINPHYEPEFFFKITGEL